MDWSLVVRDTARRQKKDILLGNAQGPPIFHTLPLADPYTSFDVCVQFVQC